MEHIHHHTVFGFCWLDLPALIILLGIILFLAVRHTKLKRREKELKDRLDNIETNESGEGSLID